MASFRLLLCAAATLLASASALHAQGLGLYKKYDVQGIQPVRTGSLSGATFAQRPLLLISGISASGSIQTHLYSAGQEGFSVNRGDTTFSLPFSRITQNIEQVWRSSSVWHDFDGDGDQDLVLMGARGRDEAPDPVTSVYINDRGSLSPAAIGKLAGLYDGALAAGNLYGDARAYVVMTGTNAQGVRVFTVARLVSAAGAGGLPTFLTSVHFTGTFGLSLAALALGDCDGDGDLDVALSGLDAAGLPHTRIYRNNTETDFAEVPQSLPGVFNGGLAMGDVDGDGSADLLLTGAQYGPNLLEGTTRLYHGSNCIFTEDASVALPPIAGNTALLADHDLDGDLDILINGLTGNPLQPDAQLSVFNNDGTGRFRLYNTRVGALYGNAFWLDLNRDGVLDPLVTGETFGAPGLLFYRKPKPGGVVE